MRWPRLKISNYVFISSPVLCLVGLATIVVGGVTKQQWIVRVGTGLFLSGVAVFLLASGGRSLSIIILAAQTCGFRILKERPLYSMTWVFFSLILMFLAIGLFCIVVRGYFLPK